MRQRYQPATHRARTQAYVCCQRLGNCFLVIVLTVFSLLLPMSSVRAAQTGRIAALTGDITAAPPPLFADTFDPIVVNSANDPGTGGCDLLECTLREAITLANTQPGADTILFNLPGAGPHTLQPDGDLPVIVERVTIDGYTQPGALPNTNLMADVINARLLIELDGTFAQRGLVIQGNNADGTIVRGLVINRFAEVGIAASATVVIAGNFIGVDPTGTQARGNGVGIQISGATAVAPITPQVGGSLPNARNLISANQTGIAIRAKSNPTIQGNFIGSDVSGTAALGNGIGVAGVSSIPLQETASIWLGGFRPEERNLIAGNGQGAVYTYVNGRTENNLFGTDRTGKAPLPNRGDGLVVLAPFHLILSNLLAYNGNNGIVVREPPVPTPANWVVINGNTLIHNGKAGITIPGNKPGWQLVSVSANVIAHNGELGIDLGDDGVTVNDSGSNGPPDSDSGPNLLLNYPSLGVVGSDGAELFAYTSGWLNNRTLGVELFASPTCDPSGYGEGERPVGGATLTKDEFGRATNLLFTFPVAVPPGSVLTATATDFLILSSGDRVSFTSEFSPCRTVAGVINHHLNLVGITTSYDPALTWPRAPAGTFTITATFQNIADAPLTELFFKVKTLTNNNRLLAAIGGPGDPIGVGAVLLGPTSVAARETFTVIFHIGLAERNPFTFLVDTYGVSAAGYATTAAMTAETGFTYTTTAADLQTAIDPRHPVYLPWVDR